MKRSIVVVALLAAGFAVAGTTEFSTDSVIGVLPVCASNKTEVILSVPWVQAGDGGDIAVSNLVKTTGLTYGENGATLSLYDPDKDDGDGGYWTWNLTSNTTDNVVYWDEATGLDPSARTIKRGMALFLTRKEADTNNTIYIIGQVGSTASITNVIKGATNVGGELVPSYTLIAPPCITANGYIGLNDPSVVTFIGDIDDGDEVTSDMIGQLPYRYVRNKVNEEKKWVFLYNKKSPKAKVNNGRGFWYKRCGTSNLKIVWNAPSVPTPAE